jgi:hypothetical protein
MKLLRVAEGCFSKQEVENTSWTVVGWASVTLEATPISLSLSLLSLSLTFFCGPHGQHGEKRRDVREKYA